MQQNLRFRCLISVKTKTEVLFMKKMMAVLGASIFTFTGMSVFAGCSEQAEGKTVMNVSLNPEVEFVLDADNKVVSVNALNEEGNLIVSAEVFTGKSAEEAAQLFVKVSKETGNN